jgi:hypothetical protein
MRLIGAVLWPEHSGFGAQAQVFEELVLARSENAP